MNFDVIKAFFRKSDIEPGIELKEGVILAPRDQLSRAIDDANHGIDDVGPKSCLRVGHDVDIDQLSTMA
jgi:hypothetical protein